MTSRRDFLKLLGASAGGAMLVQVPFGCSETGRREIFRFYSMVEGSGGPLMVGHDKRLIGTGGGVLPHFHGEPMLSDTGRVVFQAYDANENLAMFSMTINFAKTPPAPSSPTRIVTVGDILEAGTVKGLESFDLSREGELAIVLKLEKAGDVWEAVYVDGPGKLAPVLPLGMTLASGEKLSALYHDVAISAGNVLVVARHVATLSSVGAPAPQVGLLFVPVASPQKARFLLRRHDLPLGPDHPAREFGLIDLHGDDYLAQVAISYNPSGVENREEAHTLLVRGTTNGALPVPLAVTHEDLAGKASPKAAVAEQLFTPRLHRAQTHWAAVQDDTHALYRNGVALKSSDGVSASGRTIVLLSPAVVATGHDWFHLQTTLNRYEADGRTYENATVRELALIDAENKQHVLLQSGSRLEGDTRRIWDILFGSLTRQANQHKQLVCQVVFADETTDPNAGTHPSAIVVGVPA